MADEATLLLGVSGSGKTNFALTFPHPRLILDIDCKARDAIPGYRLKDTTVLDFPEPVIMEALTMRPRPKAGETPTPIQTKERPIAFRKLVLAINEVYKVQEEEKKYRTVIVDSWSTLCDIGNREMHYVEGNIGMPTTQPQYGVLHAKWLEMIPVLLGIPCEQFVLTAHEELTKDETSGRLYYSPLSYGQAIRALMPIRFSNVYRCITSPSPEGLTYSVQTRPSGLFNLGKTKHPQLPHVVPSDYRAIVDLLKMAEEEVKEEA